MASGSSYGHPLVVSGFGSDASTRSLKPIPLTKEGEYDEKWLQHLIMKHPGLLPIEHIEPALTPAIPICMELPVPSGYVDNLYATPLGDLIIVEAKLWRNYEARREVLGQIIDYAKDLSSWSYEELEDAIRRATKALQQGATDTSTKLYEIVRASAGAEIDESRFIDAVMRNLRRGRFLLLIVGDGIQEGVERLTSFLQQHAGLHFTLSLVEMAIFALPDANGYIVQPRIVARTTNIDRGIVTIDDTRIDVRAPQVAVTDRRISISEERFYEELATKYPDVPNKLRAFVERISMLGVVKDFGKASMILRWRPDESHIWSLCAILTDGKVWTEFIHAQADTVGLIELSHAYVRRLASAVPGAYVKESGKATSWHVDKNGTYISIDDLLAHADGWYAAIEEFTTAVTEALKSQ